MTRAGGDIYFTYDWCQTWWHHYGRHRQLHILAFHRYGKLVGLLPLMIDRLWVGPVSVRLAKLVGSDSTTAVLNPPVLPHFAEAVYTKALTHVLIDQHCDAAWFGPLAGERPHREHILAACRLAGQQCRIIRDREQTVHTIFHLPTTYEDYLTGLRKDQRAMIRREQRLFAKEHQPTVELIDDPALLPQVFRDFVEMHQQQWAATNMLGHFGDMPHSEAFNRDLIAAMGQQGRVWILRIYAGAHVVAYEYAFVFGDRLFWRLPARQVDPMWERLGLGRISLAYLIEAAIGRTIRCIEGGAGCYPYKRRMGAVELPVGSILIASNRRVSRVKAHLFRWMATLLNLVYYRIWFSRVAPRLPLRRRPLWDIWIRSRL